MVAFAGFPGTLLAAVAELAPGAAGGVCAVGTRLVLLVHPASANDSAEARIVNVAMARQRLGESFIGSASKAKPTANHRVRMRHFCVSRLGLT